MNGPRVGDRVRVVIEADVGSTVDDEYLVLNGGYAIFPAADYVVSVEVLPKPLKVGDTIEGEQYDSAPTGMVIRYGTDGHSLIRTASGWYCAECERTDVGVVSPRTVVYLPTEATS